MKNQILLFLLVISVTACQDSKGPKVSLGEGPEVELMKTMVENYEKGNLEASLAFYADTAKIYPQGWGLESISPQKDVQNSKAFLANFSSYDISDEIYEVVTMGDRKFLHFWGMWSGKLKLNGEEIKIPFFLNPAMQNGKIVMQSFYSDGTIASNAIQKALAAKNLAEETALSEKE